jgi:cell wall-associated NlpC family hydrolase
MMTEDEIRELAVKVAMSYLGTFYLWGGDDPKGFDCSGFVIEIGKSVGVLPRSGDWTAASLANIFATIEREELKPGDLVFWKNSSGKIIHIEMCLNNKLSIGASGGSSRTRTVEDAINMNAFIKIRPIDSRPGIWGFASLI